MHFLAHDTRLPMHPFSHQTHLPNHPSRHILIGSPVPAPLHFDCQVQAVATYGWHPYWLEISVSLHLLQGDYLRYESSVLGQVPIGWVDPAQFDCWICLSLHLPVRLLLVCPIRTHFLSALVFCPHKGIQISPLEVEVSHIYSQS